MYKRQVIKHGAQDSSIWFRPFAPPVLMTISCYYLPCVAIDLLDDVSICSGYFGAIVNFDRSVEQAHIMSTIATIAGGVIYAPKIQKICAFLGPGPSTCAFSATCKYAEFDHYHCECGLGPWRFFPMQTDTSVVYDCAWIVLVASYMEEIITTVIVAKAHGLI